jgi:hypothetical protein
MLEMTMYTKYIKVPFNSDTTMSYLKETLPCSKNAPSKNGPLLPPHGISFESLTSDVAPLKRVCFIDSRHYNAYLIVPRLVYILSTKLKGDVLHKCLGQDYEVNFIMFITRYGYATRPNPFCKLYRAYAKYTDMHNATYINNCYHVGPNGVVFHVM